eukprot:1649844-Prymnesium_polylepis.1
MQLSWQPPSSMTRRRMAERFSLCGCAARWWSTLPPPSRPAADAAATMLHRAWRASAAAACTHALEE